MRLKLGIFNSLLFSLLILFTISGLPLFAQTATTEAPEGNGISTEKNRISAIDVSGLFLTNVAADSVYTHLYKIAVMGGMDLGYTYQNKIFQHMLLLNGGIGRLFSAYENVTGDTTLDDMAFQMQLRYTIGFNTGSWQINNRELHLLLGAGIHFSGNGWIPDSADYDVLRYAWNLHTGLGFYTWLGWELTPGNTIDFSLYMPVVGVAWRPPYSGYTLQEETSLETDGTIATLFSNASFISFHNFVSLDLRISWNHELSKRIVLKTTYLGRFEYIHIPRGRIDFQNHVGIGISFRL